MRHIEESKGIPKQESAMPSKDFLHPINCECHGCMDGRPVAFKAQKIKGEWKIVVSSKEASAVVEAKLPGGALGFIAVLQEVAGLSQDRAIEVTEKALREWEWRLSCIWIMITVILMFRQKRKKS